MGAMETMTGAERMRRILAHRAVDRIGLFEHFWDDTQKQWAERGKVGERYILGCRNMTLLEITQTLARLMLAGGSEKAL